MPDAATLDMTLVTEVAAAQAAAIMMVSDGGPSWVIFSARRVDNPVHAEQRRAEVKAKNEEESEVEQGVVSMSLY
jgi:hypothetical protein